MKQLGVAAILFLAAVTISGGCGGKQATTPAPAEPATTPTPEPTPANAAELSELDSLRMQSCACSDQACVRDVERAVEDYLERHADTIGPDQQTRIACLDHMPALQAIGVPPVECDAYAAAVHKYVRCDKVPQATRDAVLQGLAAAQTAWGTSDAVPAEAQRAANQSCRVAIDALAQSAASLGCQL